MGETVNGITEIAPIESRLPTARELLGAMLCECGASCGNFPRNPEGNRSWSDRWEWFDPFAVTAPDELPEPWVTLLRAQNVECWRCGYRYVHAPDELLGSHPTLPLRGVFAVTRLDATPDDVRAWDLVHLGGQCTEHDADDKGIVDEWLEPEEASLTENGDG
jgi:hypothetical protein